MLVGQTSAERKAFEAGFKAAQAEKAEKAAAKAAESKNSADYVDNSHKKFEGMSEDIVGETFDKDVQTLNCVKLLEDKKDEQNVSDEKEAFDHALDNLSAKKPLY